MTTYKGIKGISLQTVAGDPSTLSDGLIWYDSVAKKVQGSKTAAAAWASGGNLNTNRNEALNAGLGIQTAALAVSASNNLNVESYDGSSWTEINNVNVKRYYIGATGVATAGIAMGGFYEWDEMVALSEEFDGTNWAEGNDMNSARGGFSSGGTQTAAYAAGGYPDGSGLTNSEEYDGTSWAEGNDLSAGRYVPGGGGTQTAGLCVGDYPDLNTTFLYNGTSCSTSPATLNTARDYLNCSGTQTSAVAFGNEGGGADTELFDGSTWTEVANLSAARASAGTLHTGSGSATLVFGNATAANTVEEWTAPGSAAVTFTSS